YDPFGDVSQLSATSYGALVYQGTFTRDADGRITQDVENLNGTTTTWGYSYDARGRLSTVSENGSVIDTYGYDANGNRISVNGQTVATYNADDQLTSYNGVPYTYAADGSLASAGSTTYQYDALGHLLEVKTSTETITYTYDGLGRRVGKAVNGTLVEGFLYADGLHPIAELDGSGNVVATFVYGTRPNVPDLMLKGGVTYRIISDQLGSPVEVIDTATGAVVEQLSYDAWGNITSDSNPGFQPFGFAGGLYDADTGLVHFGARDYDPAIGRWTTRDPLGFAGGDTNLYGYVLQDPINLEDGLGLYWQYSQSTGTLVHISDQTGKTTATYYGSYSGFGKGLNNPNMESVRNMGPIPQGDWSIGPPHSDGHLGPFVMNLSPMPGTNTFGRTLFRWHGNLKSGPPFRASHGCIVSSPWVRHIVWKSGDHKLVVVR
ncbi:MAG: RHS repeat-associated core domain-containing protein, partial [Solirubrobacteraceae bacterium]